MWGAVDPVAGPYAQTMSSMIRDGGQYVLYSRLGGMTANVGIPDLLYRGVTVRRYQPSLALFSCGSAHLVECASAARRSTDAAHQSAPPCLDLRPRCHPGVKWSAPRTAAANTR